MRPCDKAPGQPFLTFSEGKRGLPPRPRGLCHQNKEGKTAQQDRHKQGKRAVRWGMLLWNLKCSPSCKRATERSSRHRAYLQNHSDTRVEVTFLPYTSRGTPAPRRWLGGAGACTCAARPQHTTASLVQGERPSASRRATCPCMHAPHPQSGSAHALSGSEAWSARHTHSGPTLASMITISYHSLFPPHTGRQ